MVFEPATEYPMSRQPQRVLLDTSAISCMTSADPDDFILEQLFYQDVYDAGPSVFDCHISPVTYAEIMDEGWHQTIDAERSADIKNIVDSLRFFDITDDVGDLFGGMGWDDRKGVPGENDQWQVAFCRNYKLLLATIDTELIRQALHLKLEFLNPRL